MIYGYIFESSLSECDSDIETANKKRKRDETEAKDDSGGGPEKRSNDIDRQNRQ